MVYEFEGKTEKEAIDNAINELKIDREHFDVEVIDSAKKGIFRKGNVKIKVYIENAGNVKQSVPAGEFEKIVNDFLSGMIEKMGFPGKTEVTFREDKKIGLGIVSEHSGILIGKKGKNLDALQLLVNVVAGKMGSDKRVIVDAENYRKRREDSIVRLAEKTANQVRKRKSSDLMEPMNPFERRLVHTTLTKMTDIDTISEGDGLYKQVRVIYRSR